MDCIYYRLYMVVQAFHQLNRSSGSLIILQRRRKKCFGQDKKLYFVNKLKNILNIYDFSNNYYKI